MEYSYRKIWSITFPVLLSLLMQNLIGITDTAFMGRIGEIELGASALGSVFYLVLYMIGFGFSIGAEILMARRNGEEKFRAIGRIFNQGILTLMAMAAILFVVSYFFSPALLRGIISSDDIYAATVEYTEWRSFGFFFSFAGIMFRAFYMATTKTRTLTINGIVMVLSNVVFNYILVFGKLGFPALGITGAAIGSSLSELVSAIFFFLYTRYGINYRTYGLFRRTRLNASVQRQIFGISIWTMIQNFVSCGTWLFFFLAIEHLGERALAVSNVVRSLSSIMYLFVSAFATTGSALVSNLIGTGSIDKVMPLCGRIIKLCALWTLPLIVWALVAPTGLLRIYTDNAEIISSSLASLRIMLFSYIFAIPAFVYFLAISGTGNTRVTLWIELSALGVYMLLTYIFVYVARVDVAICWTVESIYTIILLIVSYTYLRKANWQKKAI